VQAEVDKQIVRPTRKERWALTAYYAREHRPLDPEELSEEVFAERTYLLNLDKEGKEKAIKTGPRWNVCRPQLMRPATKWDRADAANHHLEAIEPKSQMPFANFRANMDLESLAQMNAKWDHKLND
jgi:hypothetical protein